jgi:ribulose-5-phosphate 4-epimerase/fuculose-1-phosphate aldolase
VRNGHRGLDRAIVRVARRLPQHGLVVGTVGNVSARVGGVVRITPTRTAYARLRPRALVTADLATGAATSPGVPSRELPMHLAIYRGRPEARAVVHTHSPCATAWSCLGEPLHPELEELEYYGIGPVATAAPAAAGSPALGEAAAAALAGSRAALLPRHGVVALGGSPSEALDVALAVEHMARVALLVRVARGEGESFTRAGLEAAWTPPLAPTRSTTSPLRCASG